MWLLESTKYPIDQDALNQAIVSASLIAGWKPEDFKSYLGEQRAAELAEFLTIEIDQINQRQRIIVLSEHYAPETLASSEWLGRNQGVDISCLHLAMYRDIDAGDRYLTCTEQSPGRGLSDAAGAAWDDAEATLPGATGAASDALHPEIVGESASHGQPAPPVKQASPPVPPAPYSEPPVEAGYGDKRFKFIPRPWMALSAAVAIIVLAAAVMTDGLFTRESGSANPVAASTLEPELPLQPMLISGTLEDSATGQPIPGASVYYASQRSTTDEAGRFQFSRGPVEADVLVRAAGYRQAELSPDDSLVARLEPFEVRAVYLSQAAMEAPDRFERVQNLLRQTHLNSVIVAVKGPRGHLSLETHHPLASDGGGRRGLPNRSPAGEVKRWQQEGIYTIAYIALFRDHSLAAARPELALRSLRTRQIIRDASGMGWTNPAAEDVRGYNIAVAKAAAAAGFDEIQFDFARYPVTPLSAEGVSSEVRRQRLETIVSFLREATAALAPYNVFVGASVLGSVCTIRKVGSFGQRLEEFASAADYVSPMLYPSSFRPSSRHPEPLEKSFELVSENLAQAISRLGGNSRKLRPWLQNFPDGAAPRIPLSPKTIRSQVQAATDAQAGGWMLWDATSRYRNTLEALVDNPDAATRRAQAPIGAAVDRLSK